MTHAVVKTQKGEFAKFLRAAKGIATLWRVDDKEFEQFAPAECDVDELMTRIDLHGGKDSDYIYVFSDADPNPLFSWELVTYDDAVLPEVRAQELTDYIVVGVWGNDFLYFATSMEPVSYTHLTLPTIYSV